MSVSVNGASGITFNDGTSQTTTAYTGFRNRVINGDMRIDQRNSGASVTLSTDMQFSVDRFRISQSQHSKLTAQRSTVAPPGFTNSLLYTVISPVTPGGLDYFGFVHPIEGNNVYDFGFGTANASTVTLSFWVRCSLIGKFAGMLFNNATNRSYGFNYNINTADTWEYKTITIPGDTTGTWTTDNTAGISLYWDLGSQISTGTIGSWQSSLVRRSSDAVQLITTNGATFYITGVQFEKGSTATEFERRPYGTELALCQRYLPAFGVDSSSEFFGYAYATNASVISVPLPVTARVSPTGITYSGTWNGLNSANSSSTATLAFNLGSKTCPSIIGYFTCTAGTPSRINASSGSVLLFTGCEL